MVVVTISCLSCPATISRPESLRVVVPPLGKFDEVLTSLLSCHFAGADTFGCIAIR